jgi:type II secretory pathway pseudopilin PulG
VSRSRPRRRQRGFALLTALVVLLLIAEAAALIGGSLAVRMRVAREDAERVELETLGDAAVADALARLSADVNFSGSAERPFGPGVIWSEVTPEGVGHWRVDAGAAFQGLRRTSVARVMATVSGLRVVSWEPPATAAPGS